MLIQPTTSIIRGGPWRLAPTLSNREDCRRFGCPETPWNWASRWVLERAALSGGETVCDLGAGDNPILRRAFREKAGRAYLIDNLVLPDAEALPAHVERVEADIRELPLGDASVDVVVSVSVLEHVAQGDRRRVLAEVQRVLRPGGRAVLSVGHLLRASPDAAAMVRSMECFTSRGCAVFLPLNVPDVLAAAPQLRLADDGDADLCPGAAGYDERRLLQDANLCGESYADYPHLAAIPELRPILTCELGLVLVKAGGAGPRVQGPANEEEVRDSLASAGPRTSRTHGGATHAD